MGFIYISENDSESKCEIVLKDIFSERKRHPSNIVGYTMNKIDAEIIQMENIRKTIDSHLNLFKYSDLDGFLKQSNNFRVSIQKSIFNIKLRII